MSLSELATIIIVIRAKILQGQAVGKNNSPARTIEAKLEIKGGNSYPMKNNRITLNFLDELGSKLFIPIDCKNQLNF